MCIPALGVEGLSPIEQKILMQRVGGEHFGVATAPSRYLNNLCMMGLARRVGYDERYGRPSWQLTLCGIRAGTLLYEIQNYPLLRWDLISAYDEKRKQCPLSKNLGR